MAGELKSNDKVRIKGTHARREQDIPAALAAQLRDRDPDVRAAARAEIEATIPRPAYRYGHVVGFESDPRGPEYPPRVQIITDDDRNAPPRMVDVVMPDGSISQQAFPGSFSTVNAEDVELAG